MNRERWTIVSLAYGIGLLSTGIFGFPNPNPSWQQWAMVIVGLSLFTFFTFLFLKRRWRRCPQGKFWLIICIFAILGSVYFQFRIPQPNYDDISLFFKDKYPPQLVNISGKVLSEPRLTSNQRKRFWLQAKSVQINQDILNKKDVTGKIYVTIPIDQDNDLEPGQRITINGVLYKPRSPQNPGAFDFSNYLAKEGAFVGLKGNEIKFKGQLPIFGWTKVRNRITNTFIKGLGEEKGSLLSSIVLGRQAVDLSPDIRDSFMRAGLSHVLAASGFQVALLLGLILWLTKIFSPNKQLIFGSIILLLYTGITGLEPSIFRATLMGVFVLIGMKFEQKTDTLRSLLLAGFLLLLYNPLWIWSLSFQLSFIATFSLIVLSPAIEKKLDWLPINIASIIAVPVAVTIGTSPLIMYFFYTLSFYTIICNIITTPLIMLISLGGMINAIVALISPLLGSYLAQIFYYPLDLLLNIVHFFANLSLSILVVGKISLIVLIIIYVLLGLVWLNQYWRSRWPLVGLLIISLITFPLIFQNLTLVKVTILTAKPDPIVVIQNRGKIAIINLGDQQTIKYTLVPFLSQQGINNIPLAIAFNEENIKDWLNINAIPTVDKFLSPSGTPKKNTQSMLIGENIRIGSTQIKLLANEPLILWWQIENQSWLWINSQDTNGKIPQKYLDNSPKILLGSQKSIPMSWLRQIQVKAVILNTPFIPNKLKRQLQRNKIKMYPIQQEGAIEWTPKKGFQTRLVNQELTL
ncbi:ComEC/Rec2 family competence protein [Aphanothece sacrum]|uniref:Competence protein n=1 Tax=Aphanothece sacrum FPU1 TaxID=1920663 RepID=A0A401IKR9_APHSA|nr:ComEC/Rec2 family competence protein [Aphanothece sacrum]GBF81837.1 competence protein [Aphanothece sacrum FPU1]GBF85656.1 competence protein [Aphanothece sacrum FPU3]